MSTFDQFWKIMSEHSDVRHALTAANTLELPDWWLVGGFVRDVVWATLTGRLIASVDVNDIDIVFYDPLSSAKERDRELERSLQPVRGIPWSIKNQARMHLANGDQPYDSVEDAMFHFPETLSSVGLRLSASGEMISINCHGIQDLMGMVFRPTTSYLSRNDLTTYVARVDQKGWMRKWPQAQVSP